MRIFIFEHMVGGGELYAPVRPALAGAGAAMLGAAVADFQRAGCEVVTTRDARIEPTHGANETFTLLPGEDAGEAFDRAAGRADAVLVIAPEIGGALLEWTRRVERLGVASLGSSAEAIELCGDKLALHAHLAAHDVPTPTTRQDAAELSPPIVVKPRYGAGCEGVRVLREAGERPADGELVYQPWCAGRAASVSLLVEAQRVRALPAGEQFLREQEREQEREQGRVVYEGGRVPLEHALAERVTSLAMRAVRTVAGLRGFVGVDVVLGGRDDGGEDMVIEVNPRLTLSYVALASACEPGVAAAWLDATLEPRWAAHGIKALRFDEAGRLAMET